MKKYLFAIAMVLSLSMNADAAAQKHRHTPRTEQVDSTKNNRDAIEAFSDTTAVAGDSIDAYSNSRHVSVYADDDVDGFMEQVFGSMDGKAFTGIIIVHHRHRRDLLHQQKPEGQDQTGADGHGERTADT